MADFFRAYRATKSAVPTYFIESTAPNNVDDEVASNDSDLPDILQLIKNPQRAINEIAAHLAEAKRPNLVVMVHGFNNPRADVLQTYKVAATAIQADRAIRRRKGLVCVGYRWPSEGMGAPRRGSWAALPTLPTWILYIGIVVLLLSFLGLHLEPEPKKLLGEVLRYIWNPGGYHLVALLGWTIAGLVLTAVLLRIIVYYRDVYRATNYGVPDLVQIIRSIDGAIMTRRRRRRSPVELSFIGHSMGGFVVTNTIRILSDVFAGPASPLNKFGVRGFSKGPPPKSLAKIGNVFVLKRFVLASPDIPAETLLSSRSNFLASSLMRFKEAYLFSNEGDEVLRQISTLANFFMFPTKSSVHGFRLGNVEVLSNKLGLIKKPDAEFLKTLRVGNMTLQKLYDALERATNKRRKAAKEPDVPATKSVARNLPKAPLPRIFSYFDCTDYCDSREPGAPGQALLTFAKLRKQSDPNGKLRWYSHLWLLLRYIKPGRPNVHGGYFEGVLARQLIFRLACLGYRDTVKAFGGRRRLTALCVKKQIRVLLSPNL